MRFETEFREQSLKIGALFQDQTEKMGALKVSEGSDSFFEAGKQAEWNAHWDGVQQYGRRVNYQYAFTRWEDIAFKPKYDIRPTNAMDMFYSANITEAVFYDAIDRGIAIDTSQSVNMAYAYCCILAKEIPFDVSLESVKTANASSAVFAYNANLETIKKIILPTAAIPITFFANSPKIKEVRFEGTIRGDVNMQHCKLLSPETAKNILLHLRDLRDTGEDYSLSCKFSGDTWALLDAEGVVSGTGTNADGWTWSDYLTLAICWDR